MSGQSHIFFEANNKQHIRRENLKFYIAFSEDGQNWTIIGIEERGKK